MITKRSYHMPMLTKIVTANRAARLLRVRLNQQAHRDNDVTEHHDPERSGVVTVGPPRETLLFDRIVGPPREEEFHCVGVADDHRREQQQLRHVVEVILA